MLQPPRVDDEEEKKDGATSRARWSCCTAKTIVTFLLAAGFLGGAAVGLLKPQEDMLKDATILHSEAIKREEFLLKNATPEQVLQVLQQWSDADILEAANVVPRAWNKWQYDESDPSYPSFCTPAPSNWKKNGVQKRATRTGLMFVKIPKCASSTGATVALRMATTIPREFGLNFTVCENRLRHAPVENMHYGKRDPSRSFLWSQVRDPTRRAISDYFHLFVSRNGINASDDQHFKSEVGRKGSGSFLRRHIFARTTHNENDAENINRILNKYNFVGLAERLEESTVLLQLLLGLKPRNCLYMRHEDTQIKIRMQHSSCRCVRCRDGNRLTASMRHLTAVLSMFNDALRSGGLLEHGKDDYHVARASCIEVSHHYLPSW